MERGNDLVSWFSAFSNVGKLKCFKRVIPDMSWEVFRGSRRKKGRKFNTIGDLFLSGKGAAKFPAITVFCCLLVNVNCPVLALGRFWDIN